MGAGHRSHQDVEEPDVDESQYSVRSSVFRYQSFGRIPMQTKTVAGYDEEHFVSTPFGTRFVTQAPLLGSSVSVLFSEVAGKVVRRAWVSDDVLHFVLSRALCHRDDVLVLHSRASGAKNFQLPKSSIRTVNYLIHPVFCATCHWGIVIFELDWKTSVTTVHIYDPMNKTEMRGVLTATWESFTKPLVDSWHSRDHPEIDIGETMQSTIKEPMQQDGWNCGFLCIIVVMMMVEGFKLDESLMHHASSLADAEKDVLVVDQMDLEAFRLRVLHLVLLSDREPQDGEAKLARIQDEIKKHCTLG